MVVAIFMSKNPKNNAIMAIIYKLSTTRKGIKAPLYRAERRLKMLVTGNFKYGTIEFQGKTFITRDIHVPGHGDWTISDLELEGLLLNDGEFVSDEARSIDCNTPIDYYIEGWKLRSYSDEELAKAVAKECA